ncbi:hypothetical protein SAMN06265337_4090 [Hymenobacter gelipurpurascens]|uniref:Lipopolysaccharide assembly protein A domain-containing protein n=1 Tax=Hymenobacter gelipurpurascens TaxID=89968 RepID=A0A212UH38_9BACT|nr:hypothetical protein [Hymenobacter gelipurpurascens]SNC77506.1 hypothetical protein SAMN06265337_4090 [Hymenobacter gelipurpurascens]
MLAIKRLITILVMVFLLLGLLILLSPAVRNSFSNMAGSPESLFFGLFITAIILLGLQLITENLDSTMLRRDITAREGKINELKARLYDQQMEQQRLTERMPGAAPRTGVTTIPEGYVPPSTPTAPSSTPYDSSGQPLA